MGDAARGFVIPIRTTKPQSLAGQKPLSERHKCAFLRGKRAGFLEKPTIFERIETQIPATRQCHVQIAGFQGSAGIGHGQQRGSARTIDGVAAALENRIDCKSAGMVFERPPARVSSPTGGNGLCIGLEIVKKCAALFSGQPCSTNAVSTTADIRPAQAKDVGPRNSPVMRCSPINASCGPSQPLAI